MCSFNRLFVLWLAPKAKFNVQVKSNIIREESFTSGLELKNCSWQQISELENSFSSKPPSLSANGLLKGYAGPQVDMQIYDLIGPYMLVPYMELDADIQQTLWWILYGGLEVGMGVRMELFDETLVNVFYPKVIDLKDIDVHYGEILRLYSNFTLEENKWYHVVVTWMAITGKFTSMGIWMLRPNVTELYPVPKNVFTLEKWMGIEVLWMAILMIFVFTTMLSPLKK